MSRLALGEKHQIYASSHETDCGFIWQGKKIEIGGRHKNPKNSDYVVSDELDLPVRNRIPLWMLGLMR